MLVEDGDINTWNGSPLTQSLFGEAGGTQGPANIGLNLNARKVRGELGIAQGDLPPKAAGHFHAIALFPIEYLSLINLISVMIYSCERLAETRKRRSQRVPNDIKIHGRKGILPYLR